MNQNTNPVEPAWKGSSVRGEMHCEFGGVDWTLTDFPNAETPEGKPAAGWYLTGTSLGFLGGVWTGTTQLATAVDVANSLIRQHLAVRTAPAVPSLPDTVYVVTGGSVDEPHGAYADREEAIRAAQDVIRGDADRPVITWSFDDSDGHATVHGAGLMARVTPVPLHAAAGQPEWLPSDSEAPSLAWAAELDDDDQADFLDDVLKADTVADLRDALSTWWVIAMGERAHLAAPGPETHNLPVVDQAAVTAALDTQDGGAER